MPWKYLVTIVLLIILIIFIGFNLDNKANVSFIFTELKEIPVYFLILISFALGALVTIPVSIISRQRTKSKKIKGEESKQIKKEEKARKKSKKSNKPDYGTEIGDDTDENKK